MKGKVCFYFFVLWQILHWKIGCRTFSVQQVLLSCFGRNILTLLVPYACL